MDANSEEIVAGLRRLGISVYIIGLPLDCLVCHRGETSLLEIKTEEGRLTKAQVEFIAIWPGKVHIAKSLAEAVRQIVGEAAFT